MIAVGPLLQRRGALTISSVLIMTVVALIRIGALITAVSTDVEGRSPVTMAAIMVVRVTLTSRDFQGTGEWPAPNGNSGMALPKMAKGADRTEAVDVSRAEDKDPALGTNAPKTRRTTRTIHVSSADALGTSTRTNVQPLMKNAEAAAGKAISTAFAALQEVR